MPKAYDWDGTTSVQLKKAYDWDGTHSTQLKKGYDWDGTTSTLIFGGAEPIAVSKNFSQFVRQTNGTVSSDFHKGENKC